MRGNAFVWVKSTFFILIWAKPFFLFFRTWEDEWMCQCRLYDERKFIWLLFTFYNCNNNWIVCWFRSIRLIRLIRLYEGLVRCSSKSFSTDYFGNFIIGKLKKWKHMWCFIMALIPLKEKNENKAHVSTNLLLRSIRNLTWYKLTSRTFWKLLHGGKTAPRRTKAIAWGLCRISL